MTDLTEQWKKGELPSGWYWCKCYNEEIKKLYYDGDCFELDDPETKNYYFFLKKDCAEITILEKEPSFEEWQALNGNMDSVMQTNQALCKKLAELKELLKECRECVDENLEFSQSIGRNRIQPRNKGLLKRIDEVLK